MRPMIDLTEPEDSPFSTTEVRHQERMSERSMLAKLAKVLADRLEAWDDGPRSERPARVSQH